MKKNYMKPAMQVMAIRATSICQSSVKNISTNADLNFGRGGNGYARAKERGGWDDEDWDF